MPETPLPSVHVLLTSALQSTCPPSHHSRLSHLSTPLLSKAVPLFNFNHKHCGSVFTLASYVGTVLLKIVTVLLHREGGKAEETQCLSQRFLSIPHPTSSTATREAYSSESGNVTFWVSLFAMHSNAGSMGNTQPASVTPGFPPQRRRGRAGNTTSAQSHSADGESGGIRGLNASHTRWAI